MIEIIGTILWFLMGIFVTILGWIATEDDTAPGARAFRWFASVMGIVFFVAGIILIPGMPEGVPEKVGIIAAIVGLFILAALLLFTIIVLISLILFAQEVLFNRTKRHHLAHAAHAIWEKSKRKPKEKRKNEWT